MVKEWTNGGRMKQSNSCLKMWRHRISLIRLFDVKAKLVPLPREWREKGWINCRTYIIDLTSSGMYRYFSTTCKWYLWFVIDNFAEKSVLKIVNWIYIFLGSDHRGNCFPDVIIIKTLFALAKPSAIADCQAGFRGLNQ